MLVAKFYRFDPDTETGKQVGKMWVGTDGVVETDGRIIVDDTIRGPDGKVLTPKDGLAYLELLPFRYHSPYLWAALHDD